MSETMQRPVIFGAEVRETVSGVIANLAFGSPFERMLLNCLGVLTRGPDGEVAGLGQYVLFYDASSVWQKESQKEGPKAGEALGQWIFAECGGSMLTTALQDGRKADGQRVVVAFGSAVKSGNTTAIVIQAVGVGIVVTGPNRWPEIRFEAAATLSHDRQQHKVQRTLAETEFVSVINGYYSAHREDCVVAIYPVDQKREKRA